MGKLEPLTDDLILERLAIYEELNQNQTHAAERLGIERSTMQHTLRKAAERGMMGTAPVIPGFAIRSIATKDGDGAWIKQVRENGEEYEAPAGHRIKGESALVDAHGRLVQKWIKTREDVEAQEAAMRAVVEAFKEQVPRAEPVAPPAHGNADLLNQFTVTDMHMGCLAWGEETGDADYDLSIAEQLLLDWFSAAVQMAPQADTAVFAQIGDLLHHDAHASVTPAHGNVLDADSRLQKIIRVAIRTLRRVIAMLLGKHAHVHIIMADANHDPAGSAWLREMFAAFFEDEPRITVDSSASTYMAYEFGLVSLFYHHGHKRTLANIDTVFAGRFREQYGRTQYAYAHLGHAHHDAVKEGNLMKVESHETLAAPDAYAANGGWLSKRSAKVITYHREHGEVGRITLTPEMVSR